LQIMGLQRDDTSVTIYEQGAPVTITVAELSAQATSNIHKETVNGE